MYIKLKIEDDLLSALESDADEYVRTCTQQAMYIIKSHYKKKLNGNSMRKLSSQNINLVTDIESKELLGNTNIIKDVEVPNSVIKEPEECNRNIEFLDDEIYNF